jgi:hypothetical protein
MNKEITVDFVSPKVFRSTCGKEMELKKTLSLHMEDQNLTHFCSNPECK